MRVRALAGFIAVLSLSACESDLGEPLNEVIEFVRLEPPDGTTVRRGETVTIKSVFSYTLAIRTAVFLQVSQCIPAEHGCIGIPGAPFPPPSEGIGPGVGTAALSTGITVPESAATKIRVSLYAEVFQKGRGSPAGNRDAFYPIAD